MHRNYSGPFLIVSLPMASPLAATGMGKGPAADSEADLYDSNLDFFRRFLFDPGCLNRRLEVVRNRHQNGGYRGAAAWACQTAEEIVSEPGRWAKMADGADKTLEALLSVKPPAVEALGEKISILHELLSMVSAAFYPTRIGWGWICCPTVKGPDDVGVFARDPAVNPFLELADGPFAERIVQGGFSTVVFVVTSAAQCPGALTLAEWCRKKIPSLRRVLRAPPDISAPIRAFFDAAAALEQEAGGAERFGPGKKGDPACGVAPRLVRWQVKEKELDALAKDMDRWTRAGAWNHLDLQAPLLAGSGKPWAAPLKAVRSWCRWEKAAFAGGGVRLRWPETVTGYTDVAPLPGVPLWCVVRDPFLLIPLLEQMTASALGRYRFDAQTRAVFRLGDALDYRFLPPGELLPGEMDEVCNMVRAGGSVKERWVRYNLERAFLIGVVRDRGVIVANSSLKHPRQEYIDQVSRKAGIDLTGFLERGYTSVRPEYRAMGIGTRLLAGLTARAAGKKIFSIISEDNIATQKIAIRNRTKKVATFHSHALKKPVGVWMPEALADTLEEEVQQ